MSVKSTLSALARCLGLGLLALVAPAAGTAAPDPETRVAAKGTAGVELVAFEAPGCIYCPVFRRDVAPSYAATRAGKAAPLRFIDINDDAAARLNLASPVTIVPTFVLVRDGVEIGRIAGHVGRESLQRLLDTMLPPE